MFLTCTDLNPVCHNKDRLRRGKKPILKSRAVEVKCAVSVSPQGGAMSLGLHQYDLPQFQGRATVCSTL